MLASGFWLLASGGRGGATLRYFRTLPYLTRPSRARIDEPEEDFLPHSLPLTIATTFDPSASSLFFLPFSPSPSPSLSPSLPAPFPFPFSFLVSVWSSFYALSLSFDLPSSSQLSQGWRRWICPVLYCKSNLCGASFPISTPTTSPDGHSSCFVSLRDSVHYCTVVCEETHLTNIRIAWNSSALCL